MSAPTREFVLVAVGPGSAATNDAWLSSGFVRKIVRFKSASPSGLRRRSRALGLGLDSVVVGLMVVVTGTRGPYLAANPWIGVSLRLLGKRHVTVTGIYADETSASYRILRRVLGSSPVVTTVDLEAESWRRSGGNATSVLYGNTFGYPVHSPNPSAVLRIFVGGSSDRDAVAIAKLEDEVRASEQQVELTIASNAAPDHWTNNVSTIIRTGWIPNAEFGRVMSSADVVFLPLKQTGRAAGHMVTVGALETGLPVGITPSTGMNGYVDTLAVRELNVENSILDQLRDQAAWGREHFTYVREVWDTTFSLEAYVRRVGRAIRELDK